MNQNLKLLVFATLVLLGIAFYWYEIRPANIREKCAKDTLPAGYERCLNKNGLVK
jgi:hypothetical protein